LKILLFGDERGLPVLIEKVPRENIVGIVCASIRPQHIDSLAELAAQQNLQFFIQPKPTAKIYSEFVKEIQEINPDLIWVYSYSMILRDDILLIPAKGAINIHGALLPQYRGANPTQWAILNGETETGVTLHVMNSGVDEGPIIDQQKIPLFFEDTWKEVFQRNNFSAQKMIENNIAIILGGSWKTSSQNEKNAGYCRRRTVADGFFVWEQPVYLIYNLVRALVKPLPGAFYKDKTGAPVFIDEYQTIQQVIKRKYGIEGKQELIHNEIQFLTEVNEKNIIVTSKVYLKSSNVVAFIAKDIESSDLLGWCYIKNINWRHRNAEIDITFDSFNIKSYSTAIQAMCKFAFKEINLNRVEVRLNANNKNLVNLYEEIGFVAEGILDESLFINQDFINSQLMAMFKSRAFE